MSPSNQLQSEAVGEIKFGLNFGWWLWFHFLRVMSEVRSEVTSEVTQLTTLD